MEWGWVGKPEGKKDGSEGRTEEERKEKKGG